MVNKIMTLEQAVADVRDGMTIMVGGFLATGSPEILMDALVEKGVKQMLVDGAPVEGNIIPFSNDKADYDVQVVMG